jgi:hypothetical protein
MKENDEETQNELGNITFIDVQKYAKILENGRLEIEKIIKEWEIVNSLYDIQPKIVEEMEIEFNLEKYNKKEYLIIKKESYNSVINNLEKNINLIDEKINVFEEPKNNLIIFTEIVKLKEQMNIMLKIIKKLSDCQIQLESYMDRTTEIKKKSECFMLLKSVEKQFKSLIDLMIQKKMKVLTIYFEKEKFTSGIDDLNKLYKDLDKSLKENNI